MTAPQINGQRLYDLARQGIEVEREKRPVTFFLLDLLSFDETTQSGSLLVSCSKGTYIRTLCHDLGEALGTYGIMTALRRTKAAGLSLEDCVPLEEARALSASGTLESRLIPVETLFACLPAVKISEAQAARFCNGGALALERTSLKTAAQGGRYRVQNPEGCFLGLGEARGEELAILRLFPVG